MSFTGRLLKRIVVRDPQVTLLSRCEDLGRLNDEGYDDMVLGRMFGSFGLIRLHWINIEVNELLSKVYLLRLEYSLEKDILHGELAEE